MGRSTGWWGRSPNDTIGAERIEKSWVISKSVRHFLSSSRRSRCQRGQFLLEYTVLFAVAVTAVLLVARPVQRALNGHLGQIQAEQNPPAP